MGVFSLHTCLNLLNSLLSNTAIAFVSINAVAELRYFSGVAFFSPLPQPLLLNGLMLNLLIYAVACSGVIPCSATFIHPLKDVHIGPSWHIKGLPPPATAVISLTPQ